MTGGVTEGRKMGRGLIMDRKNSTNRCPVVGYAADVLWLPLIASLGPEEHVEGHDEHW
jgi:hypothetical protein